MCHNVSLWCTLLCCSILYSIQLLTLNSRQGCLLRFCITISSKGASSPLLPHLKLFKMRLLEPVLQVKTKPQLVFSEFFFLQQFLQCPVFLSVRHWMGCSQVELLEVIKCMIREQRHEANHRNSGELRALVSSHHLSYPVFLFWL